MVTNQPQTGAVGGIKDAILHALGHEVDVGRTVTAVAGTVRIRARSACTMACGMPPTVRRPALALGGPRTSSPVERSTKAEIRTKRGPVHDRYKTHCFAILFSRMSNPEGEMWRQ
jgi:hypothetical protein